MASSKRKWEETEDSDEEAPSYGRQILPVANLPDDFNEEPMDGLQYLFMVRRDARQLPGTVRVANPYEQPESSTPASLEQSHLPSEEWRKTFEFRFQNFRQNFNQPTIHVGTANAGSRRLMPDKKDRDMWWAFLSGRPDSEWNPTKKSKGKLKKLQSLGQGMRAWTDADDPAQNVPADTLTYNSWQQRNDDREVEQELRMDVSETLPSAVGTPVPLDCLEGLIQSSSSVAEPSSALTEEVLVPREPTTALLKSIDERVALHLLMYFTHWINTYVKPLGSSAHLPLECHARWIFFLLSRVDEYVAADDMNLLRNLARACISLLKLIKQQQKSSPWNSEITSPRKMEQSSCWIIITTIAGVWKQRDLWMDAEDILRQL
ncbi:hypothetical protein GALMADRAFT_54455 [Galerina marginata CBS 339.88]|uniref:Uncharacterized protein n=1 Tax=Galerina marginata (strain CBS 339.88) TaxID=685588 RepID=A0A067TNS1_GALM3|nr:hypothetical protein GALMADRAFT_54455 [Galerina marginata CBS 339.88]